eukprot:gene4279-4700_t
MKYLEHIGLERISHELTHAQLGGGLALQGRIEIYSTKRSTEEKKLAKQLESKILSEVQRPPPPPLGSPSANNVNVTTTATATATAPSPSPSSKDSDKAVVAVPGGGSGTVILNLIQTLNAAQLDHDFSQLTADSFLLVPLAEAIQTVNSYLAELTVRSPTFLHSLWKEVNESMDSQLSGCEVYRLADVSLVDDLEDGIVWSFHYFFCSKELKRICYFRVNASSKFRKGLDYGDSDAEEDEEEGMDVEGSSDGSDSSNESDGGY